jgi:autotransporter-associated beta strand protein
MKLFSLLVAVTLVLPAFANNPGGFTSLVTTSVTTGTETVNGHSDRYLDNGILHVSIQNNGNVDSIKYLKPGSAGTPSANGIETVSQSGVNFGNHTAIYYYIYPDSTGDATYSGTITTSTNIDLGYLRAYNPAVHSVAADVELHYMLGKGNTGLYCYMIVKHPASFAAYTNNLNISFIQSIWPTAHDNTNFLCENQYLDDFTKYGLFRGGVQQKRNGLQPNFYDDWHTVGVTNMPKEIQQYTTGVFAGCTNGKYSFTLDYPKIDTFGMASDTNKIGLWYVAGGHEYQNNGPTACEYAGGIGGLILYEPLIAHYQNTGLTVSSNANWSKIYGPWMLYFNSQSNGLAAWADSQSQGLAEKSAWPYAWLTNAVFQSKSQRASVSGKLVISDPLRPQASAAGAWIGMAAPDDGTENASDNWQFQSDGYQFWTRCAADGSFTLPPVTTFSPYGGAQSYKLYAYCAGTNGSVGEFQTGSFTFAAGAVTNLGTLVWKVPHAGSQVLWEIGYPDRTAAKYRHGDEYGRPSMWLGFGSEFSSPLEYYVASNNWATALNYAHTVDYTASTPWKWHLNFNLASVKQGTYWLNIAYAAADSYQIVRVNNDAGYVADFTPDNGLHGDTVMIRQGIHSKYTVAHVPIPSSALVVGANVITLDHEYHTDHGNDCFMYDYLNLEAPLPQLTWRGDGAANLWDVGISSNWFDGGGLVAYNDLSPVIFDDTGSALPGINITAAVQPASVFVNANKDYYINSNALYGTMSLIKSGTGALSLNNSNFYTGGTIISNGTLLVNGLVSSSVTVAGGALGGSGTIAANVASWDGAVIAPGKSGLPGTLTIANSLVATNITDTNGDTVVSFFTVTNNLALTNNTLFFHLASSTNSGGGVNDLLQLSDGALMLAGTNTIVPLLTAGLPAAGTYTLIAGGSATAGGTTNLAWGGVNGGTRQSYTLDTSLPGNVLLRVTNNAGVLPLTNALVWRGTNGNFWDTATTNWQNGAAADVFYTFDPVVFNDTSTNGGVSISGVVQPGAILVSNVSRAYTISNGVLAGTAALVKSGSGALTLTASNSYTGGTVINAGTISLANDTANQFALGTGAVTLNGGTLAMYSNFSSYNNAYWNLIVPAGATGTLNADARCDLYGNLTGSGTLNLNLPNIRTGFHGDWSDFAGQLNIIGAGSYGDFRVVPDYSWPGLGNAIVTLSNGAALYYAGNLNSGAGTFVDVGALAGASNTKLQGGPSTAGARLMTWRIGLRNTDSVFAGTISEQTPGTTTTCITKLGTGMLTLAGNNSYAGATTIAAGTLQIGNGGTAGTLGTNSISNSGTLAFNRSDAVGDTNLSLITGGGNFAQSGSGTFTITKSQPYTGATLVNSGTLALSGGGAIASSANIVVASGALFDVSGTTSGNLALASGQTLSGNGSVKGNLAVGVGATLSPGNPLGTLTFSNALSLAAGSTTLMTVSHLPLTNDAVKVFGALTNGGSLVVSNAGGATLTAGDSFKLFTAATYTGAFASVNLPSLAPGLAWKTNSLNSTGLVSVISIVPAFTNTVMAGTNLVLRGAGGLPNGNYYVLASTNLALPLSNWLRVATNYYDTAGNFAFTNATTPGAPQKFFLISLP